MKRAPITRRWVAAGIALPVLAVVVCELAGWPFLRSPVQRAVADATQVPVLVEGRFRAHLLWRPRVEVEHLRIGAGGGVAQPHLLDARDLAVHWQWGDMLRWRRGEPLRIDSLTAATIDARLVRGADGHATWQLGKPRTAPREPGDASPAEVPRFGLVAVRQGLVVVDDHPLDTRLRIEIAGREGERLADGQAAGYTATAKGRWRALPLDMRARTGPGLPLLREGDDAPPIALQIEGQAGAARIGFDGSASALMQARQFSGKLRFQGPSLAKVGEPLGVTLPDTPPFDLEGAIDFQPTRVHLRADRATIGRSRLAGDFTYDSAASPPRLTGRLNGKLLALADLGPAVGTAGPGQPPQKQQRVLPQRRLDLPSLRVMDADVQVAIDELDFGSDAIAPLRQLQTHLLLAGGVLQLQDLKAVVAGGRFGGNTVLDARDAPARWSADVGFSTVDIAGWLPGLKTGAGRAAPAARSAQALKAERESTVKNAARADDRQPVRAYLTGSLNGHVKAAGNGNSTAEILSTLKGNAQLVLRDGTISHLATEAAGLDLAQGLGVLIRGDNPLPLRCARLDLVIDRGVVRPQVAVVDNRDSTIRIDGQLDLRDESLNLRAVTRPKDFSPLAFRTPVTVRGTLAAPKVGIEAGRLAGKAAGALALGAVVAPLAALLPFLDPGSGDKNPPCDPTAPPPPAARTATGK